MPRKSKPQKKKINLVINGSAVAVTLFPPTETRTSWYVYWKGLNTSKATGQQDFEQAVRTVEEMLKNGGKKKDVAESYLTDAEFDELQRRHYSKRTDSAAQKRSEKSLRECLDAIRAFREISGLSPITVATPDDCERFQRSALELPKNWRVQYSKRNETKRDDDSVKKLSANTVVKWSVSLQAAFERANKNGGKKCVRGVVPESKLLTENPWKNFTWIEGFNKEVRQFDHQELVSLLDYFEEKWPGVTFAATFAKVMFWSWARRLEVSGLRWSDERRIGSECHFRTTGKWDVTKWFRVPDDLRSELDHLRTDSDFVFGSYPEQLRNFYSSRGASKLLGRLRSDFAPENLGDWMYHRVKEWSDSLPNGAAYLHVFRKTALQHALTGEHIEQVVAEEASITPSVMRTSYAKASDEEYRRMSNRTFERIRRSLPVEVAVKYGCIEKPSDRLSEQLDIARARGDWEAVARLALELEQLGQNAI